MRVEVKSKKGLRTILSVIVDKKSIQIKMDEKLTELQKKVALKGFRPGKVPPAVIKSQFGKSIYGEVVDIILRETSSKAINEKKLKVAGQPKIDLKQFGEGKDLNYELQIDCLPDVSLKSFDKFKATEFKVKIEDKVIDQKLKEIANQNKQFVDKDEKEKAITGDQVIFDYSASIDGNKFEGSEGKGVQIELGKDLFLKGFDEQLVGVKKGEKKLLDAELPANHPKKELANKKTKFECTILNIKKSKESKINDEFAKMMGAKNVEDLKPAILDIAPKLGDFLVAELLNEIGSPDKVLAYGKASMTGMRGSIQHASALIHTLHFGNKFRDAVGGTSYLSFTNVRGLAASKMSIPMMHKTDPGLRQFYLTHEFTIHDAPGPAELVIAIGASTTPQAHHRIGNRYEDEKEMGLK